MSRMLLAAALLALSTSMCRADEPKKPDVEKVPAPKVKVEPSIIIMPYVPPRTDTLEVWQHYGLNRMGRFVPRVITTPYGDLYSRTLEPYPWAPNRPTAVLPKIFD